MNWLSMILLFIAETELDQFETLLDGYIINVAKK